MSTLEARFLFWSPRILGIAFALFISIFALDVFGEARGLWATALALLIHLIPAFLVLAVVAIAWRREWVGAFVFTALALIYSASVLPRHWDWATFIALPMVVIAGLFAAGWVKRGSVRPAHG